MQLYKRNTTQSNQSTKPKSKTTIKTGRHQQITYTQTYIIQKHNKTNHKTSNKQLTNQQQKPNPQQSKPPTVNKLKQTNLQTHQTTNNHNIKINSIATLLTQ